MPALPSYEQLIQSIVTWLARSYPHGRVPIGLIQRGLGLGLEYTLNFHTAAGLAGQRGLLMMHGRSTDGLVVSLTPVGAAFAAQLLQPTASELGAMSPAAEQILRQIVATFDTALRETARQWAVEAGTNVDPLHLVMAARTLTAGAMAVQVDAIDTQRDKSQDGPAAQALMRLLFNNPGGAK